MSIGLIGRKVGMTQVFDEKGDPLFPTSTRALGRVLDAIAKLKDAETQAIDAAIRKVIAGGRYVTPSLAEKLAATIERTVQS